MARFSNCVSVSISYVLLTKGKKWQQNTEQNHCQITELQDLAHKLRIHSVNMTTASKSGHPTSCSSMAEVGTIVHIVTFSHLYHCQVMSVLFYKVMRYSVSEPKHAANDRFILSKGHAAPILYAAWAEVNMMGLEYIFNPTKSGWSFPCLGADEPSQN